VKFRLEKRLPIIPTGLGITYAFRGMTTLFAIAIYVLLIFDIKKRYLPPLD